MTDIKILRLSLFMLLLSAGCSTTEIIRLDLTGTIYGTVHTRTEYGGDSGDQKNVLVTLEGSDPLISTTTDSSGRFFLNHVPSGTYDLVFSREGYGTIKRMGYSFVGDDSVFTLASLYEKSSVIIQNLTAEITDNTSVNVKAMITYDTLNSRSYGPARPYLIYCIHDSPDVSFDNCTYLYTQPFVEKSGSLLNEGVPIGNDLLQSGRKIYIVLYGNPFLSGYRDPVSRKQIYTSTGKPSDIVSVTIP